MALPPSRWGRPTRRPPRALAGALRRGDSAAHVGRRGPVMADRVGFIGVGRMGGPIGRRLLDRGYELLIRDVDDAAVLPFKGRTGVAVCGSPREVAARAGVVLLSLPLPATLDAVPLGPDGLAETAEAMAVATKAGIPPPVALDVLNASSGRNSATQEKFPRSVLTGTFDFGFLLKLMLKDVKLFEELAEELAVPTIIAESVANVWRIGVTLGLGAQDLTAIAQLYERWAGAAIRATDSRPMPEDTPGGRAESCTKSSR